MSRSSCLAFSTAIILLLCAAPATAQLSPDRPTWWSKYQRLLQAQNNSSGGHSAASAAGANVDASNECGPQSETYITLDSTNPSRLAAGSNEIFRLPMRGYFSPDGGASWGALDLPLPPAQGGPGNFDFGSDPSLAFDTRGNVFYSFIVVFFSASAHVNGTEMAVARSTDGGRSYPGVTFFSFSGGNDHFNDKPMIASDTSLASPFRDNVYVAWDAANGGSSSGGVLLGRSTDHAASFAIERVDDPTGQGRSIAAIPFTGPGGELYVAWNDHGANTIAFNRSFDGGVTFGSPGIISAKTLPFAINIPAEFSRGALVYPSCDADRSPRRFHGRLYCVWMDLTTAGTTDLFLSSSDDQAGTWSAPRRFASQLSSPVDRFGQWLSVDATTGEVNISFYDTRNDTTGQRYTTDVFLARSTDGGASFAEARVTTTSSNEHDCNGVFPCAGINYSDQQGDYEGLVASGGVAHPIWTDTRDNLQPASGCSTGLLMEEVFTAAVK